MVQPPSSLTQRLMRHWFGPETGGLPAHQQALLLLGSVIYRAGWSLRETWFRLTKRQGPDHPEHVIGVGNLVVGGAGKTPCVLALVRALCQQGIVCGIITRGYRSEAARHGARLVDPERLATTPASAIGDEAWLLAWHTGVAVASGADRRQCLALLRDAVANLQVVVLDDGLQQRDLACDQTILVVDERGFGNGRCLPMGPLREPIGDLRRFCSIVFHGTDASRFANHPLPEPQSLLTYTQSQWVCLEDWQAQLRAAGSQGPEAQAERAPPDFARQRCLAAAGIAVPERFHAELRAQGITFEVCDVADHDKRTVEKLSRAWQTGRYDAMLMTEKDAVKFLHVPIPFAQHAWALRRTPVLNAYFLKRLVDGSKTS